MNINTTIDRVKKNPAAYLLFKHLHENEEELGLTECSIYFEFPLYKEGDSVVATPVLLISPHHGVITFGVLSAEPRESWRSRLLETDKRVDQAFGHLYSRLIRNRNLRTGRNLLFNLEVAVFCPEAGIEWKDFDLQAPVVSGVSELDKFIDKLRAESDSETVISEVVATIEGSMGLIRPREKRSFDEGGDTKSSHVAALEAEIQVFDSDQKHGYMAVLDGPQRIRGLAGSGKTVVLAMKAALTHLTNPDAKIGFTFYTKSLYQHVKRLITRFYRQFDDQDPNWENLQILHAWGGRTNPGIYYNACVSNGQIPFTYKDALGKGFDPFDFVCKSLLKSTSIEPVYDYVFVDEGQDFPSSFLRLCVSLAQENRLVWAYDELQTIFQAQAPSTGEIFGRDKNGEPLISLDEDIVLRKCYRNPREVLVVAHAIGFGLYSKKIVQLLENKEHWEDLGYEVADGDFSPGSRMVIHRPMESSPSSISERNTIDEILSVHGFDSVEEEMEFVAAEIEKNISREYLHPEDIVVILADDRYHRQYARELTEYLTDREIEVNNLQVDSYGIRDFSEKDCVTLTTVHKAKGNEAYMVYVVGADSLFADSHVRSRNRAFTAMTRAKAWLRVTGLGVDLTEFKREVETAKNNCPDLIFTYPTRKDIKLMQRDLDETATERAQRTLDELQEQLSFDEFKSLLQNRLQSTLPKRSKQSTQRRHRKKIPKGRKLE